MAVEFKLLLLMEVFEVVDQVDEVTGSDVVELFAALLQGRVEVANGDVHLDEAVGEALVFGVDLDVFALFGFDHVGHHIDGEGVVGDVDEAHKFGGHLPHAINRPVSKPINHTAIEQRRRRGRPV